VKFSFAELFIESIDCFSFVFVLLLKLLELFGEVRCVLLSVELLLEFHVLVVKALVEGFDFLAGVEAGLKML
jgi:hypothetical protein